MLLGACLPRGPAAPSSPPHQALYTIVATSDGWLALGAEGQGVDGALLMVRQRDGEVTVERPAHPRGALPRDVIAGESGGWIVGERALPGTAGPLGHPNYAGVRYRLDGDQLAEVPLPGLSGTSQRWHALDAIQQLQVAAGVDSGGVHLAAFEPGGAPVWQVHLPEWHAVDGLVAGPERAFALLSSEPAGRVGERSVLVWSETGRLEASHVVPPGCTRLTLVAGEPWLACRDGEAILVQRLSDDGALAVQHTLRPGPGTPLAQVLAPTTDHGLLVAGRTSAATGRTTWAWTLRGGEARELPMLRDLQGEFAAAAPVAGGWLLAGQLSAADGAMEAHVWQVTADGEVRALARGRQLAASAADHRPTSSSVLPSGR